MISETAAKWVEATEETMHDLWCSSVLDGPENPCDCIKSWLRPQLEQIEKEIVAALSNKNAQVMNDNNG